MDQYAIRLVYTLPHLEGTQYKVFRSVCDGYAWAQEWLGDLHLMEIQHWMDD